MGEGRAYLSLSLWSGHRRGHGALYDALTWSRIDAVRLREALATVRLREALATLPKPKAVDGRLVLADDVSA